MEENYKLDSSNGNVWKEQMPESTSNNPEKTTTEMCTCFDSRENVTNASKDISTTSSDQIGNVADVHDISVTVTQQEHLLNGDVPLLSI